MAKCWDCGGSGKKEYYQSIDNGVCYTCYGTGVWYERKLTAAQEERKRIAQAKRDKYRLMALYKEYEELGKQLTPLAFDILAIANTGATRLPKQLDEQSKAITEKRTQIILEGYELQKKVTDVVYVPFRDAWVNMDLYKGRK
jgi:hypothetical protein